MCLNTKMNQKNNKPLVSVILPVYNAQDYVAEAIESILGQTYQNFELIIVDDASQDNSWKIIADLRNKHPQKITAIRLRENRNKGGDEAGNVAFRHAKGEFIARMDADDIAESNRLAKQVEFLLKNPQIAIVGSSAKVINVNGDEVGSKLALQKHQEIYQQYFSFHPMIHPTLVIRRSMLLDAKNLYLIKFNSNNDYLTFFTMISSGLKFANLPDQLLKYRIHGQNDSLSQVKRTFANTLKIRLKMLKEQGYRPTLAAWIKCLAQMILVYLMPELLIFNLYLLVRGIYTPTQVFQKLIVEIIKGLNVTNKKQLLVRNY
ncbi:MAG: glycosyltransferase [Candidatus Pacebacteria bacterium]|nr:glycosyltransferase [Candidatus Paceibacterota bacterium]